MSLDGIVDRGRVTRPDVVRGNAVSLRGGAGRLAGCDEEEQPELLEEVEILDKLPAKRAKDIKELGIKWAWGCQDVTSELQFLLISCQDFCQVEHREGQRVPSEYYPAEMSVVEFNLHTGVDRSFTVIFPFIGNRKGDQNLNGQHGVELGDGSEAGLEEHRNKAVQFYETMLDWEMDKRNHVFCLAKEFLVVAGCLEYISRFNGKEPLVSSPMRKLMCFEDLLAAVLKFKTISGIDPEHIKDLSVIIKADPSSWTTNLCEYHSSITAPHAGADGQREEISEKKLLCGAGLIKTGVELIIRWIEKQALEEEVISQIQADDVPAEAVIVPEVAPSQKVADFILRETGPMIPRLTLGSCSGTQPMPTKSYEMEPLDQVVEIGYRDCRMRPGPFPLIQNPHRNRRPRHSTPTYPKEPPTPLVFSGFSLPSSSSAAEERYEPECRLKSAVPKLKSGLLSDCVKYRPMGSTRATKQLKVREVFEGFHHYPGVASPPPQREHTSHVSDSNRNSTPTPTPAPQILNLQTIQRCLPVGCRGIGRGLGCVDWTLVDRAILGSRVVFGPHR